jgi:hypothetical protein
MPDWFDIDVVEKRSIRFADFFSFDDRIQDNELCNFLLRTGRDELEWTIIDGKDERKLTGESVIDYFTSEVIKFEAELEHSLENRRKIAPFDLTFRHVRDGDIADEQKEEPAKPIPDDITDPEWDWIDEIGKGM